MADFDDPIDEIVPSFLPEGEEPDSEDDDFEALDDLGERSADEDDLFVVDDDETELPPIGRSWAFDFGRGQFLPGPGGGPLATRGTATLRYWVEKCLRTQRGAYPIYDENYGLEDAHDLIGVQPEDPAWGLLPTRITEALTFHPRIAAVDGFNMDFDDVEETMYVSFVAVLDDDVDLPVQVTF